MVFVEYKADKLLGWSLMVTPLVLLSLILSWLCGLNMTSNLIVLDIDISVVVLTVLMDVVHCIVLFCQYKKEKRNPMRYLKV